MSEGASEKRVEFVFYLSDYVKGDEILDVFKNEAGLELKVLDFGDAVHGFASRVDFERVFNLKLVYDGGLKVPDGYVPSSKFGFIEDLVVL